MEHMLRWSEADWLCLRVAHCVSNLGHTTTCILGCSITVYQVSCLWHCPPQVQLCDAYSNRVTEMLTVRWCKQYFFANNGAGINKVEKDDSFCPVEFTYVLTEHLSIQAISVREVFA